MSNKMRTVITGGSGRFGKLLKQNLNKDYLYPTSTQLNILKFNSIVNFIKRKKIKRFIHLAALSRPLHLHETKIDNSIHLNIIGTANVVRACSLFNVKLIYFSTSHVYRGTKGNYRESDDLLPMNNYGWSKLGGECAVQMYKNSLILRVSMTEKPFLHDRAFANVKSNFIFHEDFIPIFKKILNKKGIINIGGPTQTVYQFAKSTNPKVKKIYLKKHNRFKWPLNASMNLKRLKTFLKK